jgi:HAD superfamily hydrolase (TIGR01509 family)
MTSESTTGRAPSAFTLDSLPDPGALLFDLDGTLIDTVGLRVRAWAEALSRFGIAMGRDRLAGYVGSDGRWLATEAARAHGRSIDWATSDEIDRLAGALFDELNQAPAPLPGATELLTALEASRLAFAIATSSMPGQVAVSVTALRLPAPPRITDGSHVERAKPEPDLLLAAASQLDVSPDRCWYVGDSTWDMMAAARAGMAGIGVKTGATDAAGLISAGAVVAIDSLSDLHAELRRRDLA